MASYQHVTVVGLTASVIFVLIVEDEVPEENYALRYPDAHTFSLSNALDKGGHDVVATKFGVQRKF